MSSLRFKSPLNISHYFKSVPIGTLRFEFLLGLLNQLLALLGDDAHSMAIVLPVLPVPDSSVKSCTSSVCCFVSNLEQTFQHLCLIQQLFPINNRSIR